MRSRALVLVRRSQCEQSTSSLRSHNFDLTDSRFSYSTHQHPQNATSSLNIRQNNSSWYFSPTNGIPATGIPPLTTSTIRLSTPPLPIPRNKDPRTRWWPVLGGYGASARLTEIRSVSKQFRSVCCRRSVEGSWAASQASSAERRDRMWITATRRRRRWQIAESGS